MKNEKRWLPHFRRSLIFLWPQRRRIALGIAFSVGVALTYSAGVFAILPILKILISDEGPRATVFRIILEERLEATLAPVDPRKDRLEAPIPPDALVVRELHGSSPLLSPQSGEAVRRGDVIFLDTGEGSNADEMLEGMAMASAQEGLRIRTIATGEAKPREVVVSPNPIRIQYRWAGVLASRLPVESTPNGKINTLIIFLVIIFIINLMGNACKFGAEYVITIASARAMMDLRRHMFTSVLNLNMAWFGTHLSDTMSRIVRDLQDVMRGYSAVFGKMLTEPMKALMVFSVALWFDYRLTVMVVAGVPAGVFILRYATRKIRKANQRLLMGYATLIGLLNSTLMGMRVVRAYTREGYERKRMWTTERKMFRQMKKIARAEAASKPALEVVGVSLVMIGVVWFAKQTVAGEMQPERFIQMAALLGFMFDPIRKVSVAIPRLAKADSGAARVFELMDLPPEQTKGLWLDPLPPFADRIEFRDITFAYPNSAGPALEDVSLTVHAGENVAIVGPNGSGKTTIVNLLLRFLEPTRGTILIDGKDIRQVSLRSLRQQVSLVTQDAVVFPMSARENIEYGRLKASEEDVKDAARRARADEFINRLPEGYDTVLGEFGETLSGGECQRLSMARAILRDAPIFIFDEATSQVDVDSERKIRQAMLEFMKGRTSLVIAHRITTIQHADKIIVLDHGRVVDIGDHASLIERCELYRKLYFTHLHGHMNVEDKPDSSPSPSPSPAS